MGLVGEPRVDCLYCRGERRCTSTTWVVFFVCFELFFVFSFVWGGMQFGYIKTFYTNFTVKSPNCTTISLFVLKFRLKSFDVLTLTECR